MFEVANYSISFSMFKVDFSEKQLQCRNFINFDSRSQLSRESFLVDGFPLSFMLGRFAFETFLNLPQSSRMSPIFSRIFKGKGYNLINFTLHLLECNFNNHPS